MTLEWLGFAGMMFCILAYLPQIIHLIKEKCTWGLSECAYITWAIASMLLLSYAICVRDAVFIALSSYQLGSTVLICFFCRKYKDSLCEEHGSEPSEKLINPARATAAFMRAPGIREAEQP